MMALSKFLVLLALFLLASHASAFTSLSLVTGDQVWVIHLIQLQQPMSNPTNEPSCDQFANQPIIKQQMKFNLHLLPTPLISLGQSMA
jgi:hypothetical protein